MSERLEAFKAAYMRNNEAFNRHDFDSAFGGLPDDFEWHMFETVVERRVRRGPAEIRAAFEELVEVLRDWHVEPLGFTEAAEGMIVVRCRGRATGRSSGAPGVTEWSQLWELPGGRPRRMREFRSQEDALAVARAAVS